MCAREKEIERVRKTQKERGSEGVCAREGGRENERESERVCVREKERKKERQ